MSDLIRALQILVKYGDPRNPTHCEHDELAICGIDPGDVTDEDKATLDALGFFVNDTDDGDDQYFLSFRFGSA